MLIILYKNIKNYNSDTKNQFIFANIRIYKTKKMSAQYTIGDKVAVLDDTVQGIVHAIHADEITIKTKDDFLLKYSKSDLVIMKTEQKELSKFINMTANDLLEKEQSSVKKKSVKTQKKRLQPPMEVDLHIHHLTKSNKRMDNYEMLTLQLETAKRQLEFAIKKRIQRVVFIHGIGKGVLKAELEFLFARYPVEIQQASFQKYGFGATEVYIFQNY